MGLLEFSKLPVNTLVGADWKTFKEMTRGQEIAPDKRTKYYLTKSVCRLLSLLAPIQDHRFEEKLGAYEFDHDPVFILGHWRSGTTFVHNIFAQDDNFCYTTTYQTVFPHLMMFGQPFFKKTMGWLMPDKRPTDNMELAPDLPQEEEFALSNMMPYSFYDFWFFPQKWQEYCDKYLTFENITKEELQVFKEAAALSTEVELVEWDKSIKEAKQIAAHDMGVTFIETDVEAFKAKVLPLHQKMLENNPKIRDFYQYIQTVNDSRKGDH